jgi:hypothetical protein
LSFLSINIFLTLDTTVEVGEAEDAVGAGGEVRLVWGGG